VFVFVCVAQLKAHLIAIRYLIERVLVRLLAGVRPAMATDDAQLCALLQSFPEIPSRLEKTTTAFPNGNQASGCRVFATELPG
jgi:hypothetical protein